MDTCSYSDCALVVRFGYVIHFQRAYPHLDCHRHCRYCFTSHQWPESDLVPFGEASHSLQTLKIEKEVKNEKNSFISIVSHYDFFSWM